MANIPGTEGPVDYPNRPEGGEQDGPLNNTPGALPGGTNRFPQPAPANVEAQQGAGSGNAGLYSRPDNLGSGAVQKGWRGDSYVKSGVDTFQPPANVGSEFVTGGPNGSSVGALSVPTEFTKASTDQG